MKKAVLLYGSIGGIIVAAVLIVSTTICTRTGTYEGNMIVGYAAMLLAFSLIFAAVKQVRDKQYSGAISFGRAFKIALLTTLVTSTIYVLVWLVCYYVFIPDFMDKYTAYMMNKARADGLSGAGLAKQAETMQTYKNMYQNPLFVVLLTYMEILPVGLIVSLIAAFILKRRNGNLQKEEIYVPGNA